MTMLTQLTTSDIWHLTFAKFKPNPESVKFRTQTATRFASSSHRPFTLLRWNDFRRIQEAHNTNSAFSFFCFFYQFGSLKILLTNECKTDKVLVEKSILLQKYVQILHLNEFAEYTNIRTVTFSANRLTAKWDEFCWKKNKIRSVVTFTVQSSIRMIASDLKSKFEHP